MPEHAVYDLATGDLLRSARIALPFNVVTEATRSDVPTPALRRGDRSNANMHRWNGSAWVTVARPKRKHTANLAARDVADATIGAGAFSTIGQMVATPNLWESDAANVRLQCLGEVKTTAATAQLRIIERLTNSGVEVTLITFSVPDTAGAWAKLMFTHNPATTPVRGPTSNFRLEARRGAGNTLELRGASLLLLRVTER